MIDVALGAGEDDGDLVLDGHGDVLALLEELGEALAALELLAGGGVQVGGELGEGGHLAELSEFQLEGSGDGFHRLDLGATADAADGEADVDGRADAGVEEVGLQEDLAVGDGDDVGGDVGGDVSGLGLDDREGGEGAAGLGVLDGLQVAALLLGLLLGELLPVLAPVDGGVAAIVPLGALGEGGPLLGHLGGALQEAGVDVEHVAGVSLAARGAAEQQGHLPVGDRLLGEIVVDDEGVAAGVAEVLGHGDAGVGRDELEGRRLAGGGGDDGGVLQGAEAPELLDHLGHGALLLADGHVEALHVEALLVDDGVEGHGGLAGLAVADDQLALAAADGDHGVDGLDAGLHRLLDGLAGDDAWGLQLDAAAVGGLDGALAVDGVPEGVDHAAEERLAHRDLHDALGAPDHVALLDAGGIAEEGDADVVVLEVEGEPGDASGELDQLAGHHPFEAVHAGDTVAHGEHRAGLDDRGGLVEVLDVLLDDLADLFGSKLHRRLSSSSRVFWVHRLVSRVCRMRCNLVRSDPSMTRSPIRVTTPPSKEGSSSRSRSTFFPRDASSCSLSLL